MRRTFVWALIAMPLLAACENKEEIYSDDSNLSSVLVTIQDIVGSWHMTLVTAKDIDADTLIIEPDGQYKFSYTLSSIENQKPEPFYQLFEDGSYTIQGNLLIDDVTMSRERYATIVSDIRKARWDTLESHIGQDTSRVTLLCEGSVMLQEYFNGPATPTSQDIDYISLYYREGASNLPSDKSSLLGTWYWKDKSDTVLVAIRFDSDSVEVYSSVNYVNLVKGAYNYKDGIVSVGPTVKYVSRDSQGNDVMNPGSPFDVQWKEVDPMKDYNYYQSGMAFPFIINGRTAYCTFLSNTPILTKQ